VATSIDHYLEAERLLRLAHDLPRHALEQEALLVQLAQAHATLAAAAINALGMGFDGLPQSDYGAWYQAASAEAPIPPATDDDEDQDKKESALRVGDLSPTGDMDARELAAWLRRVPLGSSLTDIDGDRWYRITTPTDRDPLGRHPAIARAEGGCVDDIDDHDDMIHALRFAPYTVLALGTEDGA
jgi:hypothetical protein